MTVNSLTRKTSPFIGNNLTTQLPFGFMVFLAADILVTKAVTATGVETVLALTTDYTVSLNSNQATNPGGTVTLNSPLATGYTCVVSSQVQALQKTDITNAGGFYPDIIEAALDKEMIVIQQLAEKVDRCAKLPITNQQAADALTADLVRLASSANNIDAVANDLTNINNVAADKMAIDTVAGSIGNVNVIGAQISDVGTVSTNIAQVSTVSGNITNVNTVAGVSGNVTTVAGISANVTAVAGNAANINLVAGDLTNINIVAADKANIDAVSADLANIDAVKNNKTNIDTVAGQITPTNNVATVAARAADVATVAGQITPTNNLATVAGKATDISTVAGISGNVSTVAGISSNVSAVASNQTNVNTVAGQITPTNNVATVAGKAADISTVAGKSADVSTVAGISGNVTTVAGISSNVTTVAGISAAVSTVATKATDVSTVATNIAAVTNTSTNMAAVIDAPNQANAATTQATAAAASAVLSSDWSQKITGTVDGTGYSAKYWAQQAQAAAGGGVLSLNSRTGYVTLVSSDVTGALGFTPYSNANPNGYISANQNITVSGDATGSGATAITLTLADTGITAGTYPKVTVNAKGQVTGGSALASGDVTSALGFSPVQTVAGRTGAVTLSTSDVSGLGTAATLNVGTAANNVLQLNASAQIPAVDGSLLTGIAPFPAGTLMLFQQTSAPTGWTKQTTHDNKALRVVSGTASSGGTSAFTTVFANQTPTITTSGLSAGATTLSTAQIPSHQHFTTAPTTFGSPYGYANSYNTTNFFSGTDNSTNFQAYTNNVGGGGSHTHSISGSATSSAITLNVQYVDLIIASKN